MARKKKSSARKASKTSEVESLKKEVEEIKSMLAERHKSEIACELLRIYFSEVASLGFKRKLRLADIVSAYRYVMKLLSSPEKNFENMEKAENPNTNIQQENCYINSKGERYYLHKDRNFYYFSKDPKNAIPIPEGYCVEENPATKIPVLRKIRNK